MAAATIFYVSRVPSAGEQVLLDGDEGHHAARVLRMRVGEPVMVCDGAGEVGDGVVASVDRTGLAIDVTGRWSVAAVDPKVTVVQALPKSDRSELAVDLAVEAGADEVIPWQAQRCVSRWDAHKAEKGRRRWEAVAQAASRQSRRAYVPSVPELHSTAQLAELVGARAADGAVVLVLHESAESGLGALAARLSSASSVVLIVGPEGGVADEELRILADAGAAPVRLGPTVLRTSSAAAVALGALGVLTDRWAAGPLVHRLALIAWRPTVAGGKLEATPQPKKAGDLNHVTSREEGAAVPSVSTADVRSSVEIPNDLIMGLLGSADENLRELEDVLPADVHVRGNTVTFTGVPAEVALAERVISELIVIARRGQQLTPSTVRHTVAMLTGDGDESPAEVLSLDILSRRGKTIRPKTLNQKRYVDAIDANTIVFGIGPAGTGKTYLAMAKAVNALQSKQVTRIILTRPAVEAGERLGFLPGTLSEKIDPYLRPLYDALHDMMDPELIPKLMDAGVIEVAPLAYMRGRTINDAFIILDEAQNTTAEQMKMFLTRLGFGSKIVVTGDITQVDLPGNARSGLRAAMDILGNIEGIHFSELTSADVVRHRLVSEIVDAYARFEDSDLTGNRAQRRASGNRSRHR